VLAGCDAEGYEGIAQVLFDRTRLRVIISSAPESIITFRRRFDVKGSTQISVEANGGDLWGLAVRSRRIVEMTGEITDAIARQTARPLLHGEASAEDTEQPNNRRRGSHDDALVATGPELLRARA
jgi:hypothetical protein